MAAAPKLLVGRRKGEERGEEGGKERKGDGERERETDSFLQKHVLFRHVSKDQTLREGSVGIAPLSHDTGAVTEGFNI